MNFADISCVLNKLKMKQKIFERNGCEFIKSTAENYGISLDDNNIVVSKAQNKHQLFSLQQDVQENYKILQELKNIVSPENIPKIDLLALKHKMFTLENSILNIKNRITKDMDDLVKEENILSVEVTNLEMKYSEMNRTKFDTNKHALTSSTNRSKTDNPSLYQEVEDFANYVNENGGHEGGWSQNDHIIFLRYYHQIKSEKMLLKILHRLLPDFSEQKITNHIDWYKEYVSLREKQKVALEEWRRNKIKSYKCHVINNEEIPFNSLEVEKKPNNNNLQRQNIKEKIYKWKLGKQEKLQQDTENRLKTDWEKDRKSAQEKKMKHDKKNELREDVGKWRASKQAQEKANKLEQEVLSLKEKERKISIANALIREFQKQDSLYIMRRINKHNTKTSNFFPATTHRKDSHKKFRDPDRIFKATRQWLSRISCEDSNEVKANSLNKFFKNGPLNVQQIPKLRVPAWRLAAK